jgi:hypothetical protein
MPTTGQSPAAIPSDGKGHGEGGKNTGKDKGRPNQHLNNGAMLTPKATPESPPQKPFPSKTEEGDNLEDPNKSGSKKPIIDEEELDLSALDIEPVDGADSNSKQNGKPGMKIHYVFVRYLVLILYHILKVLFHFWM